MRNLRKELKSTVERCKPALTLLAVALILTAFSKSTLAADNEVPWVKKPPTIEQLTGGKVHTGEEITAKNVDLVQPYLLESYVRDIKDGGTITIVPTIPSRMLVPEPIIKATMANAGKAAISADGTIATKSGKPWLGGFPFAFPKTALEVMVDFQYDYHDQVFPKSDNFWIDPRGEMYKDTENVVEEYYMNGRACVKPYGFVPHYRNELMRTLVYDTAPYDLRGIAVLTIIYVDQSKLPDSWGYIPVLRRVQRFSSAQRYDSVDGSDLRAGDINTFSDPLGLWTFKLLARKPMLFPVEPADFPLAIKNKGLPLIKGKYIKGLKLQVRDCYLVEATPKDPSYIYSKKILLIDASTYIANGNFYDKQGKLWLGYYTIIAPYKDPCGNSFRAVAYPIHNYQTGSASLAAVYSYKSNSSDTKLEDFTLRNISTMGR